MQYRRVGHMRVPFPVKVLWSPDMADANNPAAPTGPVGAFDFSMIQKMLMLAGKYGPAMKAMVEELLGLFNSKQGIGPVGDVECNDTCCTLLCEVKRAQIQALVKTMQLEAAMQDHVHPEPE